MKPEHPIARIETLLVAQDRITQSAAERLTATEWTVKIDRLQELTCAADHGHTFSHRNDACMETIMNRLVLAGIVLIVTGCASSPNYRTDFDSSVDFRSFQTFAFMEELGTDRAGYSTLVTQHFKNAISREMTALGYEYTDEDPDLLVNFSATSRENTEVRSRPTTTVGVGFGRGYYGYRTGIYSTFPLYGTSVESVSYKVGTANIDVIDAKRKMLVWEGVAEGRLRESVLQNPRPAIDTIVSDLFARFPTAPQ